MSSSSIDLRPFRAVERAIFEPPEELTPSEWADRYRILDEENSGEPGPWDTARVPYLRGIMDAVADYGTQRVTIKKSVQAGCTEAALNMLGFLIDQDPSSVIWAVPRQTDIGHFQWRRLWPFLTSSPRLADKITGRKQDEKAREIRLSRGTIYVRAAMSKADLASQPARVVIGDECDRWPQWAQDEGDPTELLADRTTTFWNRKIVMLSTPTTAAGHIERLYDRSDQRRYFVPCPFCGCFQPLELERVKRSDPKAKPDAIRRGRLAFYECRECERAIPDRSDLRARMLGAGVWVPAGGSVTKEGKVRGEFSEHAGFHVTMLLSTWRSWSDVLAQFLEVKHDPAKLRAFINQWLGETWKEKARETSPEFLATLAHPEVSEGEPPEGTQLLTAGVDVQQDHFWVIVRAWGFDLESWLVKATRVETWGMLWDLLQKRWGKHPVALACIDSNHRTWEVYEECWLHPELAKPIRGADEKTGGLLVTSRKVESNPTTGQRLPGLLRWDLQTGLFKDKIAALQRIKEGDPGRWHAHRDPPEVWLEQCAAEHQVFERHQKTGRERYVWRPKSVGRDNHLWDCEVYALAAAYLCEAWTLRRDVHEAQQEQPRRRRRRPREDGEELGGWLGDIEGMP